MNDKEFATTVSEMLEGKWEAPIKDPNKKLFYLQRAEERAANPEFKELWKRKKEELIQIYNS